ncbi:hypothetical protein BVC80_9071g82 [Macleaya cordata]|uniref:Golgin candidate 2 n=1 Tax=Macleaya cordata TaxID=56857 RepID=A0A200PU49_MACCD|nr:hypothetical protein BVC80_9071g82 [Macleaya cordata]
MAGWISSKLKVAETFLQQIDQTAAESLGKNEKPRSDELNNEIPTKIESVVPLKDQLKKKTTPESLDSYNLRNDRSKEVESPGKVSSNNPTPKPLPPSTLTDSDWTELLSTPKKSRANSNGMSVIRGSRKDVTKLVEVKKNQTNRRTVSKPRPRQQETGSENSANGGGVSSKGSDGEESGSSDSVQRKSGTGSLSDERYVVERENVVAIGESVPHSSDGSPTPEKASALGTFDGIPEKKKQLNGDNDGFRIDESDAAVESSVPTDSRRDSSSATASDGQSVSDSDSSSSSESENERKRREERERRRAQIMAEKVAAKALEAIKERENAVARLEGEKQSLEKILEERAKQQALEASELQMSMMETMEAVDLEKQKHKNTRMEALTRLAKLETANADLARSLAATQWNLEVEANRVAELRQQLELKEGAHEELKRRMSKIHQSGPSPNQEASRGAEFERDILEAEYSFTCDKIAQLHEKAKKLEESIEVTRKEMENPTVVEVELKRRLSQLTDHLIQKQAQVEALSSEKATLLLRIETTSRLLDEEKSTLDMAGSSSRDDLEAGTWDTSKSKVRPLFADRIRSGGQHFGSLLLQLDIIFSAGAAFLRRNSSAKLCALVYIVCLHFWVVYILMSNSEASDSRSGAVFSLESINKTTGS